MTLYTLIIDYDGGTYVSQYLGANLETTIIEWSKNYDFSIIPNVSSSEIEALKSEIEEMEERPLLLEGLVNIWCTTYWLGEKLLILNVVKTNEST